MSLVGEQDSKNVARWSVGGIFIEALANRDYARMGATLRRGVRFRAMLPPGPMEWEGPDAVIEVFSSWFGGAEEFELVDATVGDAGGRLHLSWRLRVRPAPFGIGEGWHVIEQQVYADAIETIEALDLLCSGLRPERRRTLTLRGDRVTGRRQRPISGAPERPHCTTPLEAAPPPTTALPRRNGAATSRLSQLRRRHPFG